MQSVEGVGRDGNRWIDLSRVMVTFDHSHDGWREHSLNIDFFSGDETSGDRIAVELSPESATRLAEAIQEAVKTAQLSGDKPRPAP